jgi:hypothetical protein
VLVIMTRPDSLSTFPASIVGDDVESLRWYFKTGGLSVFGMSTFGAQLDRAALFCYGGHECEKCLGSGFVPSNERKWREATEREAAMLAALDIEIERPLADTVCGECKGMGWIANASRSNSKEPLTARPTGSSKRGKGADALSLDDCDMVRLGRVTRALGVVSDIDETLGFALAAYYSPGDWAPIDAVKPLTPAGKKLLKTNPQKLAPQLLFSNIEAEQREKPDPTRGALLGECAKQARDLYEDACRAWNFAVGRKEARLDLLLARSA